MFILERKKFDAVLFDLDGVVTQTAAVHTVAWKELFDHYLKKRAEREDVEFEAFDATQDYRRYVDGKPRYEGVRSFLAARGIEIPYGAPEDSPDEETVCGLGNRKNDLFNQVLEREGVRVFDSTVALIRTLRDGGIKTAIVSSSKNCVPVLEKAGLTQLFDIRVDGVVSAQSKLKGKPAPDIFLEAAKDLDVRPQRAAVVEDAISGVQAGRSGKFGLVIGVARHGNHSELRENGADIVVSDLAEIAFEHNGGPVQRDALGAPSALERFEEITARLKGQRTVVFLDYDGTLTPIVDKPEKAILSAEMRSTIRKLASRCPVAVISGRGLRDVQRLVQIDTLFYAGSHGFELSGPEGLRHEHEEALAILPVLEAAAQELQGELSRIEGSLLERKRFSIAVHFRGVNVSKEGEVEALVDRILSKYPDLRKGGGKKVFELRPAMDWHKGKAVVWILETLEKASKDACPIYIGDDVTDEDAFETMADKGIGIVVEAEHRFTRANYRLEEPKEVNAFLERLAVWLKGD